MNPKTLCIYNKFGYCTFGTVVKKAIAKFLNVRKDYNHETQMDVFKNWGEIGEWKTKYSKIYV